MKSLIKLGKEFNKHSGVVLGWREGLARVAEELREAEMEHTADPMAEELADVVLTVASLAARYGLDLDGAIKAKHAINMARIWGPHPTIPGAVKHVKAKSNG